MKILLIGPQGSGKSTQAKLLSEYLNLPFISTGDIFRKQASVNEIISTILQEGKLVDDTTTSQVVKERLAEDDCQNGFIMDGYPRNIHQQELFDPRFDKVIYLKVPNEEFVKRLMTRGREDDTKESIQTRLNLYYEQTQPLLSYYEQKGILKEVDGLGTVEEIQQKIRSYFS